MSFQYTHDNPHYPQDNRPYLWAWNLDTGELVWKKDFSEYGSGGNDCGIAMMDGKLYYSTFFGYDAERRRRRGVPAGINGLTARIDPANGEVAVAYHRFLRHGRLHTHRQRWATLFGWL